MDPFSVLGLASMGSSLLGGLFGDDEPQAMPTQQTGFAALPPQVQQAYLNLFLPEVQKQFQGKYFGMPMGQAPTGPFASQELQNLQRYSNSIGGLFGGGTGVNPIGQVEPFNHMQMHALNSFGAGLGLNQTPYNGTSLGRIFQAVQDITPQAPQSVTQPMMNSANEFNMPRQEPVASSEPSQTQFGTPVGDLFNTPGSFQSLGTNTAPNIQPWESLNDYLMAKRKAELQGIRPEIFETMYRGPNSPGAGQSGAQTNNGPSFGGMPGSNGAPQSGNMGSMPNAGGQQFASAEKILPQTPIMPVNAGNPNSFNGQYGLMNEQPAFMNPFNEMVMKRTLNELNKQTDEARSGIMGRAARYGGLGAFGSSALGTQLAQLENASKDRALDFIANSNLANYNQALGLRRQTLQDMMNAGGAVQGQGQAVLNALQPQLAAATPQGRLAQFSSGLGAFPQSGQTMQYSHQPNFLQKIGSAGMGLMGGLKGFGFI